MLGLWAKELVGLGVTKVVICWAHTIINYKIITLLLIARDYTTLWK